MRFFQSKALIIFFSFLSLSSCSKQVAQQNNIRPVFVKMEAAQYQAVTEDFETVGELKADKEILVSAERAGQVEKIYVSEGRWVNAGETLVKIKGNDVKADYDLAQADYERMKALYDQGAISAQNLMQYQNKLNVTESQVDNLLISAVTEGLIGEIYVDPGDYVRLGDRIMDLVKVYPLRISYSIPEKLLAYVKLGQAVEFTSDIDVSKAFQATVNFVAPRVDPDTRTILVRAQVSGVIPSLKANQFVRIKQTIKHIDQALMVREESLYLEQGQEYLYLADRGADDKTYIARKVAVQTGLRQEGRVQVLEGLKEGENVIYAGLHSIYPGATLTLVDEN